MCVYELIQFNTVLGPGTSRKREGRIWRTYSGGQRKKGKKRAVVKRGRPVQRLRWIFQHVIANSQLSSIKASRHYTAELMARAVPPRIPPKKKTAGNTSGWRKRNDGTESNVAAGRSFIMDARTESSEKKTHRLIHWVLSRIHTNRGLVLEG